MTGQPRMVRALGGLIVFIGLAIGGPADAQGCVGRSDGAGRGRRRDASRGRHGDD